MCFWLATVTDRVREGHLPDTAVKESTVLELYRFDDYQSVYPERRRTLGGTRPICGTGGCSASYVSGRDRNGSCVGEQLANMIQPFWALPVLAIAGISLRRVMGFTVMSFFVGTIVFGLALLVLV